MEVEDLGKSPSTKTWQQLLLNAPYISVPCLHFGVRGGHLWIIYMQAQAVNL